MPLYYFAYGSNIHQGQMRKRCPLSHALHRVSVPGYRLTFRDYADLEKHAAGKAQGVLYRLTPRCEAALDVYEGVGKGSYRKTYMTLTSRTLGDVQALVYRKTRGPVALPPSWYLQTIADGFRQWDIPLDSLKAAVTRAANAALRPPEEDLDLKGAAA